MSSDTVAALPRGLRLFAPARAGGPLRLPPAKQAALVKLGIRTVQDLLQHYPRYHVDRSELRTIRQLAETAGMGETRDVQVHARLAAMGRTIKTRSGKRLITGRIADETGSIQVTWFNQEWVRRVLQPGDWAFFYGRLGMFRGKLQMTAPRFELVRTGREPFNVGRIIPIYPATAELSSDQLRRLIWDQLQRVGPIVDPLPPDLRERLGLMPRGEALRLVHFPETKNDVLEARRRLVFDEVFTLQLGLVHRKKKLERSVRGIAHRPPREDSLPESFVRALPFPLTTAQRRACDEIASDMSRSSPMHRLLEGEVGSGKTVVALYACLLAMEGGHQAAFMAPTEVLAEQHHVTISELLGRAFGEEEGRNLFSAVSRRPVVRLLTGSTSAASRAKILQEASHGEIDLLVGTHALIQEAVEFQALGIAVVDEQHRFGVHQRKELREKGGTGEPDVLVMTATPIPRTLAVTIYGDLDLSVLDELPKGRRRIVTQIASGDAGRQRAYDLIRGEVAAGRQAYVVYALRDESDRVEIRNAKAEAKRLAGEVFPDLRVGLVHGDMPGHHEEAEMRAFREGLIDVLVATTVIEVGVDVPNATVMLIEDAERFGLAQLHQLRGRVGRGSYDSYCLLATELDLSRAGEDPAVRLAAERLDAVAATSNGFDLALVDLRQRGEGQLFGARQSGLPQLKMARVLDHMDIVKDARVLAEELLDDDPDLNRYEHIPLRQEIEDRFHDASVEVVQSG